MGSGSDGGAGAAGGATVEQLAASATAQASSLVHDLVIRVLLLVRLEVATHRPRAQPPSGTYPRPHGKASGLSDTSSIDDVGRFLRGRHAAGIDDEIAGDVYQIADEVAIHLCPLAECHGRTVRVGRTCDKTRAQRRGIGRR